MHTFLMVSVAGEDLSEIVEAAFEPENRFAVNDSAWLVCRANVRSSWEVWEALAPSQSNTAADVRPRVIIVPAKGYYGRANASVWQWLEVKGAEDG